MTAYPGCAGLARSPFVLTEHISSIYICVWRYICHISSACHVYVMWAELGHSHFLCVPAVSNIVTNGIGMGTKNVLKGTVRLGLSLVSSLLSTVRLL